MFDKIILFSIKNKLVIGFLTLAIIACGVYSLSNLALDAQPDITNNQVQVITLSPNLGTLEVEQFITSKIELSMGNIPKVVERRSLSRSGLSVVTLVFKDDADIYWARQQIAEQISQADIPSELGKPEMAPISTGLGEIYQYTLHTKPGYEKKYSLTDLRTMQDWIVRTQLSGTPGIAEINAWGGLVKQYEVAVDNERLNASGVSMQEVFAALQANNESSGGSYIESHDNAYFIRGLGQVGSLGDIENMVIKNVGGVPVTINNVAVVKFGSATRYGAITRDGKGEVVAGITLMLKGENFNQVIKDVKTRIATIQRSLPEGVVIEPFIDRTELVGRAIHTVEKNLIEGGLIVVFILVLLLGNYRAGLIVASVIPLAMLFAVSLMHFTGVSGNLMSLGAIDFGLIVDGAVIIVEAIVHRITESNRFSNVPRLSQDQMDNEVYTASSKIRNSAAFGEIIILIVYLPIFTLVGIEGKMFSPMAQTVAYAILGAFILSLTYVPMMSSLFLSKNTAHKRNLSDRIMAALESVYMPVLDRALKIKRIVIVIAIGLFALSLWIFSGLGGEFLPTLEEGDFALEVRLIRGTSLTKTIETFTQMEQVLKKEFPEIRQIVSKIGSAEIPSDPMPIEGGDVMLAMKPKDEWVTAKTKEEMIEKIQTALKVFPGLEVEVSQPMQMRFNELISGVKQDVAIKIYGDNLDVLSAQANQVAAMISGVQGVDEPKVEKVTGLPQIVINYNRPKIAQYGLKISDVNTVLRTAYAGNIAGTVYEGEKRFDLVVRLQKEDNQDIETIKNLYIPLSDGTKIPLREIADVRVKLAPEQISREEGKRRIFVGFNVRGRDVQSVVNEIQTVLNSRLKLPVGYYISYGGQFENLIAAKKRLSIAVPAALLLILTLLYFTFNSIKQTLLIFTAVPLSAIGGVIALWLRGMPFSISAGVGFIALFGVAVLNGIVLIGYFNQLEEEGVTDVDERIKTGARVRLRPVIMTASVASFGFLPMALSTGAGAEVQKPLATVVVGGLITATLLTLILLPILYKVFTKSNPASTKKRGTKAITISIIIVVILFATGFPCVQAQTKSVSLQEVLSLAYQNNINLQNGNLSVETSRALQKTAFNPDKTAIAYQQDPARDVPDKLISVSQNFLFPTVYKAQANLLSSQNSLAERSLDVVKNTLIRDVKIAWYNLIYSYERLNLLSYQDSIYRKFSERADLRYKTGETSNLERLTALSRYQEIQLQQQTASIDLSNAEIELRKLLNTTQQIIPGRTKLLRLDTDLYTDTNAHNLNPLLGYYEQQVRISEAQVKIAKSKLMPDLNVGISTLMNPGAGGSTPHNRIGYLAGISIPLISGAQRAQVKAAKLEQKITEREYVLQKTNLLASYSQQSNEYQKIVKTLDYYEKGAMKQAEELLRVSGVSYNEGEIGYIEYIQNITQYVTARTQYLDALSKWNQAIIQLNFLKGIQ